MNEAQFESIVTWFSEADAVFLGIKVEAAGFVEGASQAVDGKAKRDLINQWGILAKGLYDVTNAAIETLEAISDNAKGILPHRKG